MLACRQAGYNGRMENKKSLLLLSAGVLLALNIVCWREVFLLREPQLLKVDFLAVGQGDAEFIETPQGQQILIDGGPNSQVLEKLNQRMPFWDKTIDAVILTHPEKDHMAGILDVLKRYKVDYFLWTGVVKNDAENKLLSELLNDAQKPNKNATKIISVKAGDSVKAGNVLIEILFPFENVAGKEEKNTSNNTSLVSRLVFGQNSFIFTADIDSSAEKQLVSAVFPTTQPVELLKSDVLKVAHHGSKYSSSEEFIQAVSPQVAVIEVGKNSYGHPTAETLQRLEKFGIQIKRTDTDGDIGIVSDGNNITLK